MLYKNSLSRQDRRDEVKACGDINVEEAKVRLGSCEEGEVSHFNLKIAHGRDREAAAEWVGVDGRSSGGAPSWRWYG